MNVPPPRNPANPGEAVPDDLSIPILTERLGLPPLEFDTTLPLIESTGQMLDPSLEGLTALPTPPHAVVPPPAEPWAGLHPIAALPFPPMPPAPEPPPVAAAPAPVALATLPKAASGATYGGFIPPAMAPRPPASAPQTLRPAPPAPPAPPVPPAPPPPPAPSAPQPAGLGLPPLPPAANRPDPVSPPVTASAPQPFTLEPAPEGAVEPQLAERRAGGSGQHWGRIEVELRSSILRQITQQLPREIDAIVQGRMQDAIERLLTSLAEEIHLAVTASLGDIVERAVRAELDRMRNSNRG